MLAAEKFGTPLEYFTEPYRLEGEGRFCWRQMGVSADRLIEYEGRASRWIAAYRTLAAQVGKPPLVRPSLGLKRGSRYEDAIEAGERFAAEDRIVTRRDVVGVEVAARHVGRVAGRKGAGDPGSSLRYNGGLAVASDVPTPFSKPFAEVLAMAMQQGRISTRRAAGLIDVSMDDLSGLLGAHGVEHEIGL